MKLIFLIILFTFLSELIFSQEISTMNFGSNFPIFFPVKLGYSDVRFISNPGFYIEKPIKLNISQTEHFSINPGFEYFAIKENCYYARSSNEYNRDVSHKSISFYLKLNKKYDIKNSNLNWYFGAFSGIHLYNSSKGEEDCTVYYLDGSSYSGNGIIDQKGKSDFYHLIYYGTLIGIEHDLKSLTWLRPGLEFKWLPNFGTVKKDDYKNNSGGFEITLNLGFGTKSHSIK